MNRRKDRASILEVNEPRQSVFLNQMCKEWGRCDVSGDTSGDNHTRSLVREVREQLRKERIGVNVASSCQSKASAIFT